jgi:hypothetical protein
MSDERVELIRLLANGLVSVRGSQDDLKAQVEDLLKVVNELRNSAQEVVKFSGDWKKSYIDDKIRDLDKVTTTISNMIRSNI